MPLRSNTPVAALKVELPRLMPTFIDESGDTGRVCDGGKPYFRLAGVWLPTISEVERLRQRIRLLRHELGVKVDYEFKYTKTHAHPDWRRAFFQAALEHKFRFAVSSIDKTRPEWDTGDGPQQHWACATELAALLRPFYTQAVGEGPTVREPIVVDDNADRAFLAVIKKQFRGLGSRGLEGSTSPLAIGKVSFRKSVREEAIQLVDMVCGAVGDLMSGDGGWYDLIAERDREKRR